MGKGSLNSAEKVLYGDFKRRNLMPVMGYAPWRDLGISFVDDEALIYEHLQADLLCENKVMGGGFENVEGWSGTSYWMAKTSCFPTGWETDYKQVDLSDPIIEKHIKGALQEITQGDLREKATNCEIAKQEPLSKAESLLGPHYMQIDDDASYMTPGPFRVRADFMLAVEAATECHNGSWKLVANDCYLIYYNPEGQIIGHIRAEHCTCTTDGIPQRYEYIWEEAS